MGWSITYSNNNIELNLYYERISYEVYATVSLAGHFNFTIDEVIPLEIMRKYRFAKDESGVKKSISELKTLIMQYAAPFLNGDKRAFEKIMINREKARSEQDLKLIEEQAYEAWKNRDYVLVAALYQSIE